MVSWGEAGGDFITPRAGNCIALRAPLCYRVRMDKPPRLPIRPRRLSAVPSELELLKERVALLEAQMLALLDKVIPDPAEDHNGKA